MLGFGIGEIILILVVAVIVLGPDKLPSAIVEIIKVIRVLKKTVQDAKDTLDKEVNLSELKREADEYKEKLQNSLDVTKEIKDIKLVEDIKQDMNDIQQLFKDYEPKSIQFDSLQSHDNIATNNKITESTPKILDSDSTQTMQNSHTKDSSESPKESSQKPIANNEFINNKNIIQEHLYQENSETNNHINHTKTQISKSSLTENVSDTIKTTNKDFKSSLFQTRKEY
ncbi:Sec-independent protein translocase protein TatB [Helicobacter didelphidarum]|uniref:Sec-independent protein translocase protein TatB n=1 Tax=Helicobacter didelphidarum TaxID=2040648 RepID=UPI0015F17A63|nr:Sec-independent protein translocase protein TatB [Helicobacter didelphidarum]